MARKPGASVPASPARTKAAIVSSAHLVSPRSTEMSEFEFGLIVANNAFHRWIVHCMSAAGLKDLTPMFADYGHGFGLGYVVGAEDGHRRWWHNGHVDGFSAMLARYPDDRLIGHPDRVAHQDNDGEAGIAVGRRGGDEREGEGAGGDGDHGS